MKKLRFNIVEKRNLWFLLSFSIVLLAVFISAKSFFQSRSVFNYGIDFMGGNSFFLRLPVLYNAFSEGSVDQNLDVEYIEKFRGVLTDFSLENSLIQITKEGDVLIKTLHVNQDVSEKILEQFRDLFGEVEILEIDYIGPSIGQELRQKSIWIILLVSFVLLAYISVRFDFFYGVAALLALLHDAILTLSFAVIFQLEVNLAFVAALLTILGYSINDTIVIFDRIRENEEALDQVSSLDHIIDLSLNQTLLRTVNTSMTTLFVVLSLVIFGGATIQSFSLVLLIGVLIGTYSSFFIASTFLYLFYRTKN